MEIPKFNRDTEALLIHPEGEREEGAFEIIKPQDLEKGFQLEELYRHIKCDLIEIVQLRFHRRAGQHDENRGMILIVDEEGKLRHGKFNSIATQIYANPTDIIRGRAVYCATGLVK